MTLSSLSNSPLGRMKAWAACNSLKLGYMFSSTLHTYIVYSENHGPVKLVTVDPHSPVEVLRLQILSLSRGSTYGRMLSQTIFFLPFGISVKIIFLGCLNILVLCNIVV